MELKQYFATGIAEVPVVDPAEEAELISELRDGLIMLSEEDEAGQAWCEDQGYLGYTSYASLDDLPDRIPAFGELAKRLKPLAEQFSRETGYELGKDGLSLDGYWVNLLDPGAGHPGHIHPNSVVSGTFYLELPEGASAIRFEDPRLPFMMNAPGQRADLPEAQKRFVYRQPRVGHALFWESWLRHEVPVNYADEPRLSISFNFS